MIQVKTRDGRNAIVLGVLPRTPYVNDIYPLIGFVEGHGDETWTSNGSAVHGEKRSHDLMLDGVDLSSVIISPDAIVPEQNDFSQLKDELIERLIDSLNKSTAVIERLNQPKP